MRCRGRALQTLPRFAIRSALGLVWVRSCDRSSWPGTPGRWWRGHSGRQVKLGAELPVTPVATEGVDEHVARMDLQGPHVAPRGRNQRSGERIGKELLTTTGAFIARISPVHRDRVRRAVLVTMVVFEAQAGRRSYDDPGA